MAKLSTTGWPDTTGVDTSIESIFGLPPDDSECSRAPARALRLSKTQPLLHGRRHYRLRHAAIFPRHRPLPLPHTHRLRTPVPHPFCHRTTPSRLSAPPRQSLPFPRPLPSCPLPGPQMSCRSFPGSQRPLRLRGGPPVGSAAEHGMHPFRLECTGLRCYLPPFVNVPCAPAAALPVANTPTSRYCRECRAGRTRPTGAPPEPRGGDSDAGPSFAGLPGLIVKSKDDKRSDITILHQDEHILVVCKPAGVLVIPDRAGRGGILLTLRQKLELTDEQELRLVHRIDRGTSGVLLVARNIDAQRSLVDQFQKHKVAKKYLALVAGQPVAESGIIDQRLAPSGKAGMMRIDPAGKRAITKWRVQQRFSSYCLLECRPVTGRTHQIRVHMQSIGLPLAVDPLYGGAEALFLSQFKPHYKQSTRKAESPLIARLTLHAHTLRFRHPVTQEEMKVEAPIPADLSRTIQQLQKYGMR